MNTFLLKRGKGRVKVSSTSNAVSASFPRGPWLCFCSAPSRLSRTPSNPQNNHQLLNTCSLSMSKIARLSRLIGQSPKPAFRPHLRYLPSARHFASSSQTVSETATSSLSELDAPRSNNARKTTRVERRLHRRPSHNPKSDRTQAFLSSIPLGTTRQQLEDWLTNDCGITDYTRLIYSTFFPGP